MSASQFQKKEKNDKARLGDEPIKITGQILTALSLSRAKEATSPVKPRGSHEGCKAGPIISTKGTSKPVAIFCKTIF